MTQSSLHINIIGGGIGGLCLAQGLKGAGVGVSVFERDRTRTDRLQGYRIHIDPHGSTALKECLPPDLFETLIANAGKPNQGMTFLTERLGVLLHIPFDWAEVDPAISHHALSRITLRQVLLDGLEDVVQFDKRFTRFEDAPDGRVIACFEDGSSADSDVLIGADGGNSRVRKQLLPDAQRIDTGIVGIGGKVPLNDETRSWIPQPFLEGPTIVMGPEGRALFGAPIELRQSPPAGTIGGNDGAAELHPGLLFDNTRDYVLCAFTTRRSSYPAGVDLEALEPDALREVVLGMIAGWDPGLRRFVAEVDPSTFGVLSSIRTSVPVDPWPSRNVTLIGDAIHSMTPFRGIGANVALRDAAGLARKLTAAARGEVPTIRAIGEYEADMLEYGFKAVRESLRAMEQVHVTNPFSKAVTKTLFRTINAMFSLKRRVMIGNYEQVKL